MLQIKVETASIEFYRIRPYVLHTATACLGKQMGTRKSEKWKESRSNREAKKQSGGKGVKGSRVEECR